MSTHLSPIESIREMRKKFEEITKSSKEMAEIMGNGALKNHQTMMDSTQSHINLTLTSFIEAEIAYLEGERKDELGDKDNPFYGTSVARSHARSFNSALSSVIEHLQEIKKQII